MDLTNGRAKWVEIFLIMRNVKLINNLFILKTETEMKNYISPPPTEPLEITPGRIYGKFL